MSEILIRAASISNYEGMDALVDVDDRVYLGKRENYHPCHDSDRHAYYDNSDGSLQLISHNIKMLHFLYGEGRTLSQREMQRKHFFTKADYMEFASLRFGTLTIPPHPGSDFCRAVRQQITLKVNGGIN